MNFKYRNAMIRFMCFLVIGAVLPCHGQSPIELHTLKYSGFHPGYTKEPKRDAKVYMFSVGVEPMQPIGVQGRNIEPYLQTHTQAYALFEDYRKTSRKARTIRVIGGLLSTAGLCALLIPEKGDRNYDLITDIGLVTAPVGIVIGLAGRGTYKKALRKFELSIETYNNDFKD